jgi:hypothetical protein
MTANRVPPLRQIAGPRPSWYGPWCRRRRRRGGWRWQLRREFQQHRLDLFELLVAVFFACFERGDRGPQQPDLLFFGHHHG